MNLQMLIVFILSGVLWRFVQPLANLSPKIRQEFLQMGYISVFW